MNKPWPGTKKILFAVATCHAAEYMANDFIERHYPRFKEMAARRAACRETWLRDLPVPYKFFFGSVPGAPEPQSDEVYLNCGDRYENFAAKCKAICGWALGQGYEHLARVDDDTFIYPKRLLATDWENFDYAGVTWGSSQVAGACMFLSQRAMDIVATAPLPQSETWSDDKWIAGLMRRQGIQPHEMPSLEFRRGAGYHVKAEDVPLNHNFSGLHACAPSVMHELYRRQQC